jgi:hypothetical protein
VGITQESFNFSTLFLPKPPLTPAESRSKLRSEFFNKPCVLVTRTSFLHESSFCQRITLSKLITSGEQFLCSDWGYSSEAKTNPLVFYLLVRRSRCVSKFRSGKSHKHRCAPRNEGAIRTSLTLVCRRLRPFQRSTFILLAIGIPRSCLGIAEPRGATLFLGVPVVRPEPLDSAPTAKKEGFDQYPRSSRFGKR